MAGIRYNDIVDKIIDYMSNRMNDYPDMDEQDYLELRNRAIDSILVKKTTTKDICEILRDLPPEYFYGDLMVHVFDRIEEAVRDEVDNYYK